MHFPMPEGNPCFFCEIANGNTHQWQIVDEDEITITLLNGRQFEIGQCVVIPRRHVPTLLDLESSEESAVMAAAKRLARALVDTYSPDGLLLYQNNGIGSGQEVPHFHLHVVPRQPASDWGFGPPHLERLEREGRLRHQDHLIVTDEKRQAVAKIRRHLCSTVAGRI
jgi:diadenosine tetraphosphate (Ap4A) HIT family hydrolase